MAVHKIIVEYLSDGNFWNCSFCEERGEFERRNAINYRSEHKASSQIEVILGGGKGNTYNPEIPSIYDVARLEGVKTSIESRGVEFEYHNTASVDDHFGATKD